MNNVFSDKSLNYFIYNDKIYENEKLNEDLINISGILIYEVLRISNGRIIFLEEHIERIKYSFKLNNIVLDFDFYKLKESIEIIIEKNNIKNNNIKIIIVSSKNIDYIVYPVISLYPTMDMYDNGVKVGFIEAIRENPNAKVFNYDFKKNISKKLKDENLYELLLINEKKNITEGSRSNVFFINKNLVISPPANKVLKGITRMKTIEILKNKNISFVERDVNVEELENFDGVFLTGTSINALSVSEINDYKFSTSKLKIYKEIRQEFFELMNNFSK